ncbi:MAG: tyrosine-type recombinase/integrase [Treponema sp.]|nr:tyrosine-type recombinase/integrase [Treponema sp.]
MRQEYSIVARRGKKGITYYVRYFRDGKMIPSQWSTGSADFRDAQTFAEARKEALLAKYFRRKEGRVLYAVLRGYYAQGSACLAIDAARGRKIGDSSRQILHGFIVNTFIPFLQGSNIKEFEEISPVVMCRFQNYLLMEKGLLPQSINRQIGGIKAIFSHMFMTGVIQRNAMKDIAPLRPMNGKIRGCFSLDDLRGIFKAAWEDKKSYLFCALIYSAGLRNGEIQNLKANDMHIKEDICFLAIAKSKTASGIRTIPIHPTVREILGEWISQKRLGGEDYLFAEERGRMHKSTKKAHLLMAAILGKELGDMERDHITFYSGRHFYKTMLNFHNLGDIEELFMGHKVNKKVSERYNHKNKRGEKALLGEARKALEIIDLTLFQ